ncbi:torsin-1A-like [Gigantopelta aegis]|uniref:torsin-1A-like n=1 Tax=Gigantopelta aegis TaxID=1735272 RepID=UPI001B889000|nr:torsin-1A-like [Gigantopelta aegis]
MNLWKTIFILFYLYILILIPVCAIEPISGISAGLAVVVSALVSNYRGMKSYFSECCDDRWIKKNTSGLMPSLEKHLYGQHLVMKAVINHIRGHIRSENPAKALVLSFHGGTGTGKNHVSRLVAQHLYNEGIKSKFVHLISSTKEFPHEGMVPFYKDQLRSWIEGNVSSCAHSLFIFDEMDKMPTGLIDTIKPYLDYYDNLGGVDYKKAIYLFLSNTAGQEITELALKYWDDGSTREDITLVDTERIIMTSAVNTRSGLWHSDLITKHLVTAFIPFLPLTKNHVMECIRDELVRKKYFSKKDFIKDDLVNNILKEMTFYPEDKRAFSVTGCKRVSEKVDYIMLE